MSESKIRNVLFILIFHQLPYAYIFNLNNTIIPRYSTNEIPECFTRRVFLYIFQCVKVFERFTAKVSFRRSKDRVELSFQVEKSIVKRHVGQDDSYSMGHMWVRIVLTRRFTMQIGLFGTVVSGNERLFSRGMLLLVVIRILMRPQFLKVENIEATKLFRIYHANSFLFQTTLDPPAHGRIFRRNGMEFMQRVYFNELIHPSQILENYLSSGMLVQQYEH